MSNLRGFSGTTECKPTLSAIPFLRDITVGVPRSGCGIYFDLWEKGQDELAMTTPHR
jgi:hypothetical protein